jgi:hypothetical protein
MHAPPVLRILDAKANPKVLTQADGRPSPSVSSFAFSIGYKLRISRFINRT